MRLIFAILGMGICLTACQSINMVSVKKKLLYKIARIMIEKVFSQIKT